jgi:hypothetical protein
MQLTCHSGENLLHADSDEDLRLEKPAHTPRRFRSEACFALQQSGNQQRDHGSDGNADHSEAGSFCEDEAKHAGRLRTESDPDSNLSSASGNAVRNHPIQAQSRQE